MNTISGSSKKLIAIILSLLSMTLIFPIYSQTLTYPIVDTGQVLFYNSSGSEITEPAVGSSLYGQDAHHNGNQPNYTLSGDGLTVFDNVTGLTWQQTPDYDGNGSIDADDKFSFTEAQAYPATLNATTYGGYNDWRLPTIKELYSLIKFNGTDVSPEAADTSGLTPFIDTNYFDFAYGDTAAGERVIDSQYWSSTEYVNTTMNGDDTVFGVNFADGRIKGYGLTDPGTSGDKTSFVLCVRGNTSYGVNSFTDNLNGTISDNATSLMWDQNDSAIGLDWEEALIWVQQKNSENYFGYSDWRLPNAKELQSIVDYTRSPDTTSSAAINPVFNISTIIDEGGSTNYPFFWTSTTHAAYAPTGTNGTASAYIAFGEGLGWMEQPPNSGSYTLLDVHGAGCQRSDPKEGNPDDYPYGHGPQGDVIRIYNYVRLVRDIDTSYAASFDLDIYADF